MADAQHTEKPTKRRVDKARKEGNFPASREFISAVQFLGFVTIAVSFSGVFLMRTARVMRYLFERAFTVEITQAEVVALVRQVIVPELTPLVFAGVALVVLVVFTQLATTRMGISLSKLMPDIKRLNILKKFSSVPANNVPLFFQALLLLPLVGMVVYYEATENLDSFLELPWMGAQVAAIRVAVVVETLLWRAAGIISGGRRGGSVVAAPSLYESTQDEQAGDCATNPRSRKAIRRSRCASAACGATCCAAR